MEVEKHIAVIRGGYSIKKVGELLPSISIKSIHDVSSLIEDTINRIRTEPLTHHQANSIGYLSGILLKAIEVGEYEKRLEALEQKIEESKK